MRWLALVLLAMLAAGCASREERPQDGAFGGFYGGVSGGVAR